MDFHLTTTSKDWIDITGAISPAIVGVFSLLTAIVSIIFTAISIKNQKEQLDSQKEQWLYDSYIKNESEVLLKARELFLPAIEAVHFCQFRLFYEGLFEREDQNILESDSEVWKEIVNYYNSIKDLYNYFIQNENIFIKHKLDHKLDYLNLFLVLLDTFPTGLFHDTPTRKLKVAVPVTVHYAETGVNTVETRYRYKYWYTMTYLTSIWPQQIGLNPDEVDRFIDQVNDETVKKAKEIRFTATTELDSVGQYLDKVTVYGHDENNTMVKIRQKKWPCRFENIINPNP